MKKLFFIFALLFIVNPLMAFQSIVILPFANESEKQHLYWLGEGFAESLSEELLLKDAFIIERRERLAAYDDLRIPYTGDLSRATMLKIADKLAADYVVFGSYQLKDSSLEAEVKAIKLNGMKLSPAIRASGSLDDLFQLQQALRQGLTQFFKTQNIQLVQTNAFEAAAVPLHAYEFYIKGLLESTDSEKMKFFERAIEAKPEYSQALWRMGMLLSRMGRYKESTEALQKGTFQGTFKTKAAFMEALNSYLSGDFEGAAQKWIELSKSSPSPEVYNNVGVAMLRKGDPAGAGWYLAKAVELNPEAPAYKFNLAASYVLRSYDDHAVLQYRDVLNYSPGDYQSIYLISKLLEKQNDIVLKDIVVKKLNTLFQEKIPSDQRGKFPEQYNTVIQLIRPAMNYLSPEEQQYAIVSQRKFLKDTATYVKTYQASAQSYVEKAEPDKAILEVRKAVGLDPLNWYSHFLWGRALLQQKNESAAVSELEFSVWCRDNVQSHLLLAEMYRQSERYADSKVQIQKSLAIDPNNKTAMEIWGKIWDKQ
ncbi:MAG TPA: tetratricopeptide repeat protein [Acidobacteriota bacterium]|nr:tetratricopeptide repeat protein [Acidobacteriota bacterium]